MKIAAIAFFIAISCCFLAASEAYAQAPTASITAVSGSATINRAGRSFPATYGAAVQVGDRINTGTDGRVTLTLSDGSQMELTESSSLGLSENNLNPNGTRASTKVTLLGGLVRSLVRFTAGTPPNFEVHTPNAVASARGTTYDTNYQNSVNRSDFPTCREFTDVSVYDGTVEVVNPTNTLAPPVQVPAGQKTTVPCGLAALPATSAKALGTGGVGGGTAVAAAAAVTAGGAIGGVAAAGAFGGGGGGSSAPPRTNITPSQ